MMSRHADIDDLIEESHRLREELIRVASKLDRFSIALMEESQSSLNEDENRGHLRE